MPSMLAALSRMLDTPYYYCVATDYSVLIVDTLPLSPSTLVSVLGANFVPSTLVTLCNFTTYPTHFGIRLFCLSHTTMTEHIHR